MNVFKKETSQKVWQERYSSGMKKILEGIKVKIEKIENVVKTMEDSSEPKVNLVKNINLCMINLLKKLEASMAQKVLEFSSFI